MNIFKETNLPLGGFQAKLEEAKYVVYGAPIDETGTYRNGYAKAPEKIRHANANIETLNLFNHQDIAELLIHDLGDINFEKKQKSLTLEDKLKLVSETTAQIFRRKQYPVIMGGEHSILSGNSVSTPKNATLLVLDAHTDLRSEYEGNSFSHACAVRRALETGEFKEIVIYGVRALSLEEKKDLEELGIEVIWAKDIHKMSLTSIEKQGEKIADYGDIFLSIDMDVFDPSYAPGVGNPEPMGLTAQQVLYFLNKISPNTIGLEISEFNPNFDYSEITAFLAARTLHSILTTHFLENNY